MELLILRSLQNLPLSVVVMSSISLLGICIVLATCFFVQKPYESPQAPLVQEFHGLSHYLVKAIPSQTFTADLENGCTSAACSICLEDYKAGDKLRVLPCYHKFHASCVDVWLTSWRPFCPICKRNATYSAGEPPASESTPLLSTSLASTHVSSVLSTIRFSTALLPTVQTGQSTSRSSLQ